MTRPLDQYDKELRAVIRERIAELKTMPPEPETTQVIATFRNCCSGSRVVIGTARRARLARGSQKP
jgi:hypothetical protein